MTKTIDARRQAHLDAARAVLAATEIRVHLGELGGLPYGVPFGSTVDAAQAVLRARDWPLTRLSLAITEAKRVLKETEG